MAALDTGIIFVYMALMVAIGFYANYRQKNVEDYYVAGRRLGPFSIACLWLASWVGGASIVGSSARAHEIGISAVWYVLSLAIGCLLFGLFAASRIKKLGDEHSHLTYPDFMEQRFDSRTRIVATITTSAAYIAYAAAQMVAIGAILSVLLGWDYSQALLLGSVIVISYTAFGGYLAVTYTDWAQFVLLFVGIIFIGMPIAISEAGSFSDLQLVLTGDQPHEIKPFLTTNCEFSSIKQKLADAHPFGILNGVCQIMNSLLGDFGKSVFEAEAAVEITARRELQHQQVDESDRACKIAAGQPAFERCHVVVIDCFFDHNIFGNKGFEDLAVHVTHDDVLIPLQSPESLFLIVI